MLFRTNSVNVMVPLSPCPTRADFSRGLGTAHQPPFIGPLPTPKCSELCPPPSRTHTLNPGSKGNFRLTYTPALVLPRPRLPGV